MFVHLIAQAMKGKVAIWLFFLFISYTSAAQQWSFLAGTNLTTFDFKNNAGNPISGIKTGSGNIYAVQYQRKLVDTAALLLKSSPKVIFFNQHTGLAKLLGKFKWGVELNINQYNAVGDAANVSYSYQTDYIGISPSLQYTQQLYKGLSLQASGILQISQLLHGNQWVNNRFMDLMDDIQFNGILGMGGYQVGLQQSISENIRINIAYRQASSLSPKQSQGTSLAISPSSILFGITFQPLSK